MRLLASICIIASLVGTAVAIPTPLDTYEPTVVSGSVDVDGKKLNTGDVYYVPAYEDKQVKERSAKATWGLTQLVVGTAGVFASALTGVPAFALLGFLVVREACIDIDDSKIITIE